MNSTILLVDNFGEEMTSDFLRRLIAYFNRDIIDLESSFIIAI